METSIDIIKRLLKEQKITVDEFITLYDSVKSNINYCVTPNTTPYIYNPNLPYTVTAVGDSTSISTN